MHLHRWQRDTQQLGKTLHNQNQRQVRQCSKCGKTQVRIIEIGGLADDTVGPWLTEAEGRRTA